MKPLKSKITKGKKVQKIKKKPNPKTLSYTESKNIFPLCDQILCIFLLKKCHHLYLKFIKKVAFLGSLLKTKDLEILRVCNIVDIHS